MGRANSKHEEKIAQCFTQREAPSLTLDGIKGFESDHIPLFPAHHQRVGETITSTSDLLSSHKVSSLAERSLVSVDLFPL